MKCGNVWSRQKITALASIQGEGQWREIDDAIRAAGAVSPTPTFLWSVPAGVLRAAGRLNGRLGEIVDRLIGSACYSPARIERELGWRAQVGLAEGVRDMLR
jgi:nucleoside-diphosphate-sugar epimerase